MKGIRIRSSSPDLELGAQGRRGLGFGAQIGARAGLPRWLEGGRGQVAGPGWLRGVGCGGAASGGVPLGGGGLAGHGFRGGSGGCVEGVGLRREGRTEARQQFPETENIRRMTGYNAAICLTVGLSNKL